MNIQQIHRVIARESLFFREAAQEAYKASTQVVSDFIRSPTGQRAFGFTLGLCLLSICVPLTNRVISFFGMSIQAPSSFTPKLSLLRLALSYWLCIKAPIKEEQFFRGHIQPSLKERVSPFYRNLGLSKVAADVVARITAVVCTSIVFGVFHFQNAIVLLCNPVRLIPQVVNCIFLGHIFGFAKEISGDLNISIGMHMGNNTVATFFI